MKTLILILSCFLLSSCSHSKKKEIKCSQIKSDQPIYTPLQLLNVDLKNAYPKKQIGLEDIANIEYIPLETLDNVLLSGISNISISKDKIIFCDKGQDKIFLFNRQGKYINSFCRRGGGPKEYKTLYNLCVDFKYEEIYICDSQLNYRILVYSFEGEFIRDLKFSKKIWPSILFNYDDDNLISYDDYKLDNPAQKSNEYPYSLINKKTGIVTPLPIKIKNRVGNGFYSHKGNLTQYSMANIDPMIKITDGVIISDFGMDTIFSYSNKTLFPIAIRTNRFTDGESSYLSTISVANHRYLLFNIIKKQIDSKTKNVLATEPKSLLFDKKKNQIYEAKIPLTNIVGNKGMLWDNYKNDLSDNDFVKVIPIEVILKFKDKGALKGDLKLVASKLKEDDNPILMIVKFKE